MAKNIPDLASTAAQYKQAVASKNTKEADKIVYNAEPTFNQSVEAYEDNPDYSFYDFASVRMFAEKMSKTTSTKDHAGYALDKLNELEAPFRQGVNYKRDARLEELPFIPKTSQFKIKLSDDYLLTITGYNEENQETLTYKKKDNIETLEFSKRGVHHKYSTSPQNGKYISNVDSVDRAPDEVVSKLCRSLSMMPQAHMMQASFAKQNYHKDAARSVDVDR